MTAHLSMPPLPALKHLGDLAQTRPVVVVDSREQDPLPIHRLLAVVGTLQNGDYRNPSAVQIDKQ